MNTTRQTLTAGMTFTLGEQSTLLQPTTVGAVSVANRLFMAPLTRSRADADGTPSSLAAEYYAQRASAGLIISEATAVGTSTRVSRINRRRVIRRAVRGSA